MDAAFDSVCQRRLQNVAAAVDVGGVDVFGGVEGQGSSGMDDDVDPCHGLVDLDGVADVAADRGDLGAFWVEKISDVK